MNNAVSIPGMTASGNWRTGLPETQFRERALEGRWYEDLRNELIRQFGPTRATITGIPDTSRNVLLRMVSRLSVAYTPAPLCFGVSPEFASLLGDHTGPVGVVAYAAIADDLARRRPDLARAMGLDPTSARPMPSAVVHVLTAAMRYWLACNEAAVYPSWSGAGVHHQICRASQLRGLGRPYDPGDPVLLGWERYRSVGDKPVRCWDVWDIRDEDNPTFRILKGARWSEEGDLTGFEEDITKIVFGGRPQSGDDYFWRFTRGALAGKPFVAPELYHRGIAQTLFDRDSGSEIAQGALTVGVLYTFWLHICKDASWPQRVVEGMILAGTTSDEDEGPASVPADPAALIAFAREHPDRPGQFHQFDPGADPEVFLRAIRAYEQTLTEQMVPIDYSSTGGDPLAMEADAIKRQVETLYPTCREHDARYLAKCAAICNLATRAAGYEGEPTDFPEDGYGILYPAEIEAIRAAIAAAPEPAARPAPAIEAPTN